MLEDFLRNIQGGHNHPLLTGKENEVGVCPPSEFASKISDKRHWDLLNTDPKPMTSVPYLLTPPREDIPNKPRF